MGIWLSDKVYACNLGIYFILLSEENMDLMKPVRPKAYLTYITVASPFDLLNSNYRPLLNFSTPQYWVWTMCSPTKNKPLFNLKSLDAKEIGP